MMPRIIVWDKTRMVMQRNGYHSAWELLYYGYRDGGGAMWHGSRAGEGATDIWRGSPPSNLARLHPTEKPIVLAERALTNSCPSGGIVLDPFAGSGSTLMAAERSGRVCWAAEIDPTHADTIVRRWEGETGHKAHRHDTMGNGLG